MHIALLTYGTRGDVQPLIALGLGLQRRGHSVNLAAPAAYAALVRSYGLACTPLAGDPGPLAQDLVARLEEDRSEAAAVQERDPL